MWCKYNPEQDFLFRYLSAHLPAVESITGSTPLAKREQIIEAFQEGRIRTLLSKSKIMGLGLNLQVATRQVFSTCQDSWEEFQQAVMRSNRVGSTRDLNVHIPITCLERPMLDTIFVKADRIEEDAREQESLFREVMVK